MMIDQDLNLVRPENPPLLWGNMISDHHTMNGWTVPHNYDIPLEGAIQEYFGLNFEGYWPSPMTDDWIQAMERQLMQADDWIDAGNYYLGIAPNKTVPDEPCGWGYNFQMRGSLALARLTLVSDGVHTVFKNADTSRGYAYYHELPEEIYVFGDPAESPATNPSPTFEPRPIPPDTQWMTRYFECGTVRVNKINGGSEFNCPCYVE